MSDALDTIRRDLSLRLRDAAKEIGADPPERIALERPPQVALGDLASPLAFDLAKSLRRPPRAIASQIAEIVRLPAGVARVRVEGGGYVNFSFERGPFVSALLAEPAPFPPRPGKIIVEHTNINPNKAAHIGHLRNAALGDVLVRTLRFLGYSVEVQNYLDDTGVQVADVVAALIHLAGVDTEAGIREVIRSGRLPSDSSPGKGFAYLCWDLYAEIGRTYEERPETREWRSQILHAIEQGGNEIAAIAAAVAEAASAAHLATMGRLDIAYDLL